MANEVKKRQMTWQEKLKHGVALNDLDEVKADADFNHNRRLRYEDEQKQFNELKAQGRRGQVQVSNDEDVKAAQTEQKGK